MKQWTTIPATVQRVLSERGPGSGEESKGFSKTNLEQLSAGESA